jgi:FAD/FMN-containing dehydrogenase
MSADSARTTSDRSDLDTWAQHFAGEIVRPGDPGYDEARKVWNGSIQRNPAVVVRPTGTSDVIAAVAFAREHKLELAIRGGSHSIAGFSTTDGGMVVDLSRMKGIRIDPQKRRAHVQGGVLWKDLDKETQEFGLAVTGGLISSTGVAGFTLGGGIGWIQRKHGLACDNLKSADVVTVDGSFVHVSESENSELFWALRGGGGNFGIVTSFEFELHPVGPEVMAGLMFFPGERAKEILTFYRDFYEQASNEVTLAAVLRLAPPAPFLPEEFHGKPIIALAGMHAGSLEQAGEDLRSVKELTEPIADLMTPRTYVQMQTLLDASWQPGFQNYWKAEYLKGLPDAAIDVLVAHLATITSSLSDFKIPYLGGAISDVPESDTAYGHRDAPMILNINSRWTDASDADRHIAWTRDLWEAMQPYSGGGTYTNFTSVDDQDRTPDSYGEAKYRRLSELKRRYDPENVLHLNQNILPA